MDEGEIEFNLANEQSCLPYRGFRLPAANPAANPAWVKYKSDLKTLTQYHSK